MGRLIAASFILAANAVMAASNSAISAKDFVVESGPAQVQLLELYSSEGCSSCPPADAFVAGIKASPQLWQHWVPVVFHVDYWDYLGWSDGFAQAEFARQQRRYQHLGNAASVYTPQFFINGSEWRGYFKKQPLPIAKSQPGALRLSIRNGKFSVRFSPLSPINSSLHMHMALLGAELSSQVTRGENAHRQLHHEFVVLQQYLLGAAKKDSADYNWQGSIQRAPEIAQQAGRLAWAAWVVEEPGQRVVQSTGGWINP